MLVAIYVPERVSNAARHAVRSVRQILFTQMRELEVRNACELLVGRDLITTANAEPSGLNWTGTSTVSGLRECRDLDQASAQRGYEAVESTRDSVSRDLI
jgi:hypothetical protein